MVVINSMKSLSKTRRNAHEQWRNRATQLKRTCNGDRFGCCPRQNIDTKPSRLVIKKDNNLANIQRRIENWNHELKIKYRNVTTTGLRDIKQMQ